MNINKSGSDKLRRGSGFLAIMQKELMRFFTDRRMVVTTVLLPGVLIYLIYSFMGGAMSSNLSVDSSYEQQIYAVNLPDSLAAASTAFALDFEPVSAADVESIQERLATKNADLLVVFPESFDADIAAFSEASNTNLTQGDSAHSVPNIELFYNSTRIESSAAFSQMQSLLASFKEEIRPVFTINSGEESFDLASKEDAAGFMFASLLPMFLMIFLFSGCMSVAPESIAGEKERGTIATLLITPLKRWELALGKVLSLCIIALLSGASSFVGVMLSLPNLLQLDGASGEGGGAAEALTSVSLYSAQDYALLLAVILSTVVLFVALISIISAFARTIKEANTMVMPLMVVVLFVGATAMFQTNSATELVFYLVPVYNSVQSMIAIFGFAADPLAIGLTVLVNIGIAGLCVAVLTRMLESERVIFSK